MSARLEMLKRSLKNKESLFDERLQNHFNTVSQANGQPLNDKRNGRATMNKWDKQNESLRTLQGSIQKTKDAIEREEMKIAIAESIAIPDFMQKAIQDGIISQWRKHPRFFFVSGVKHGRIVLDEETGMIAHRYLSKVSKEEYPVFRDVFNMLNRQCRESQQAA